MSVFELEGVKFEKLKFFLGFKFKCPILKNSIFIERSHQVNILNLEFRNWIEI